MDTIIGIKTIWRIVRDLLKLAYEVHSNGNHRKTYHNMSPQCTKGHDTPGKSYRKILQWYMRQWNVFGNSSPEVLLTVGGRKDPKCYHNITIRGLKTVTDVLTGYTINGRKGERFENLRWPGDRFTKSLGSEPPVCFTKRKRNSYQRYLEAEPGEAGDGGKTDRTISRLWPSLCNAAGYTGEGDDKLYWTGQAAAL